MGILLASWYPCMLVVYRQQLNCSNNICHLLNSVLSYISDLLTAAVGRHELHVQDNTFTLNSKISVPSGSLFCFSIVTNWTLNWMLLQCVL